MFVLTACLVTVFCISVPALVYWYAVFFRFKAKFNGKIPIIPTIPILGSVHILKNPRVLYKKILQYRREKGKVIWSMVGFEPTLFIMDANLSEMILSSSKIINKAKFYKYFHNWLGMGLLTSTGEKWRKHRKIITPAFHFKILEDYVPLFDNASYTLVDDLRKEVDKQSTDIFPYITLCTLDTICESVMGTTVNAQQDKDSLYVRSVKDMCKIVIDRTFSVMGQFELTYKLTKNYKIEQKALKVLHNYTNSVIKRRKKELDRGVIHEDNDDVGMKRQTAFLDLLLKYSQQENGMTDTDIKEQVDTLLFEGHDTTAAAVTFCVYLLSRNRTCQEKAFAEIKQIFAGDKNRKATYKDLQGMKYLELVLKETLRLLPSVPFYARELTEDLMYGDLLIPRGMTLIIHAYVMQLDPEYFPEPNVFRPERFLAENMTDRRNTFAYVPFSAGPRNCIGQKFAMLSMKSTVSKLLMNYDFHAVDYEIMLSAESILRSRNGVRVQIKERQW